MSRDPRIAALRQLLCQGLARPETAPVEGDELDEVLALTRELLARFDEADRFRATTNQRIEALLEVVVALVAFDYQRKATVGDDNDMLDAMAAGLNMLGEELGTSTVSRAHVTNILESMDDAVLVVDPAGVVTMVNCAAGGLFDRRSEDLVGRSLTEVLPDIEVGALLEAGGVRDVDLVLARAGGGETVTSLAASVMQDRGAVSGLVCVLRDVSENRRLAAERERLYEAFQRQAILVEELSTPLIPITDQILVMPLIGPIDADRANKMTEHLLEGISTRQARVAILDITGVREVGHEAVVGITRATRAAAFIGARVLLTGVGPEVARTLMVLEVETRRAQLVTFGSLQAGIVHAMRLVAGKRRA